MKLSKLNNVVVKNSLYVLLFVISYTALLRYYNTEFFVDTTIDSVFGWDGTNEDKSSIKNQTEENCRQMALKDPKYVAYGYRTLEHPDANFKNTCFLYTTLPQPFKGSPSDKAHKTGCLRPGEKVSLGCKVPPPATTTTTAPIPTTSTPVPKTTPVTTTAIPTTSTPVPITTPVTTDMDMEAGMHLPILGYVWLNFLLTVPQNANESTKESIWRQSLADVGFPSGLYISVHKILYSILNNTKRTFKTVDEKLLAPFENQVINEYSNYVKINGKFVPADKIKYEQALVIIQQIGSDFGNISADPSMYTKEYVEQVKMIINRNTNIPPSRAENQPTPIDVRPIIQTPVFKTYEPNQVNNNTSTETPKDKPTEPSTDVSPSTPTTSVSPGSFFASISSKFLLYVLVSFVVSILFIVLIVWGAISISKAKTAPNSTF
jgi:hypothetical protein